MIDCDGRVSDDREECPVIFDPIYDPPDPPIPDFTEAEWAAFGAEHVAWCKREGRPYEE